MSILLNEMNIILDIAKQKVNKLEGTKIGFIQNKTLRDMRLKIKLPEL